jgi:hypothetical protein
MHRDKREKFQFKIGNISPLKNTLLATSLVPQHEYVHLLDEVLFNVTINGGDIKFGHREVVFLIW